MFSMKSEIGYAVVPSLISGMVPYSMIGGME